MSANVPAFLAHLERDRRGLPVPYVNAWGDLNGVDGWYLDVDPYVGGRTAAFFRGGPSSIGRPQAGVRPAAPSPTLAPNPRGPVPRMPPVTALVACPHCAATHGALIDPACVLCSGRGTLTLNADAVRRYGARVVARAVELRCGWTYPPGERAPRIGNYRALALRGVFGRARARATVGEPDPRTPTERALVGRRAVAMLRDLDVVPPAKPRRRRAKNLSDYEPGTTLPPYVPPLPPGVASLSEERWERRGRRRSPRRR